LVGKEGKSSLLVVDMLLWIVEEEAVGGPEGATHGVGACAPGPERFTERGGVREVDCNCDGRGGGGAAAAEPQAPWRAVVLRAEWEVDDFNFKTQEEEGWVGSEEEMPDEAPAKGG